jgi:hypothetical protein
MFIPASLELEANPVTDGGPNEAQQGRGDEVHRNPSRCGADPDESLGEVGEGIEWIAGRR